MKLALLGKKLGMTQVYDSNNGLVPVTVVEAGPCPVVQVKQEKTDGYNAIQIGYSGQKESRMSKPELGHLKKAGVDPLSQLKEIRVDGVPEHKAGDTLDVSLFEEGQFVDAIGVTKGKGFQGVVKRYRTAGGPAAHGSMFHRRVGSIGGNQSPGHVFKNQIMPGHMGSVQRTVQNLKIVKIIPEKNLLLIRGNIPGANGNAIMIRVAKKTRGNAQA
ncbi:MAG: 50S ribosomal protein L3 [Opitutales bacterium]